MFCWAAHDQPGQISAWLFGDVNALGGTCRDLAQCLCPALLRLLIRPFLGALRPGLRRHLIAVCRHVGVDHSARHRRGIFFACDSDEHIESSLCPVAMATDRAFHNLLERSTSQAPQAHRSPPQLRAVWSYQTAEPHYPARRSAIRSRYILG